MKTTLCVLIGGLIGAAIAIALCIGCRDMWFYQNLKGGAHMITILFCIVIGTMIGEGVGSIWEGH